MDDVIFLLSKSEYTLYKKSIPQININWWLRSPGRRQRQAFLVRRDGFLDNLNVNSTIICVRPALHLDKVKIDGCRNPFVYCGITWFKIGKNIAISELPISAQSFNENLNNDYENSDIRTWLLNWYEKRKNY